ncbi:hypothetical protein [Daejeonella lutea]|uniref:HMA domain-containing protein n=1 Tax=Daejeonella lutea TaxID=572036 RepID=A0A1T5B9L5_9SPHI|nr:hypothetical protein [Daejeonella lutea]SKB43936.1 hypothetical protein SAMN05661099_1451 [Daejeonella lutea]
MVEVFKTNIEDFDDAGRLIEKLERTFSNYSVNFDLEDRDRILRVKCETEVDPKHIIDILNESGFHAEVLEDEVDVFSRHECPK